MSAAEAGQLAATGQAVPRGLGRRLWAFFVAHPWRIAGIVFAAFLTGVFIPAVVQQWADRQKELELKNNLVTAISDLSSETVANARLISFDVTPEARDRKQKQADLDAALQGGVTGEITKARNAFRSALAAEIKAEQTLFNLTVNSLIKNGAAYEARLQTYFSGSRTTAAWASARSVLTDYFRLTSDWNPAAREAAEKRILDFLCEGSPSGPKEASDDIKGACASHVGNASPGGDFPFEAVGDEFNRLLRVRLLGGIRDSNADGYSGGGWDLFWAMLPG